MNIVFMGTPEFAAVSLQALADSGHRVVAAFTQPDKPVGRKKVLTAPPVKQLAQQLGIPVYQPASVKKAETIELLASLQPDLIAVVAYGKILPQQVIDLPPLGCINVHGSLLPKYRGAAPIQWSVINGEKTTGVTTMYMDAGLDTGDMIYTDTVEIGGDETSGQLYQRLAKVGADLLLKTLTGIADGTAPRQKQDDGQSTYAPMLDKQIAELDFSLTAQQVHDHIRGLNPWPVAHTFFDGKKLKVFSSRVISGAAGTAAGQLTADGTLQVACGDGGVVALTDVLLEGSKRMSAEQFLQGHGAKCRRGLQLGRKMGE
ncbi:methionyl-tRNA formyltransferase [Neobittarella massiliensis]|uniref:Methionyl-tRNA formyltransferase n=1 Tax=Neobittarella massiliensis (ex Bilen et al. 2018) TaxID=2041842 RepID=A0A8J6INI2_9FIRM|nr:methionyl-tRNA formyltransferase [Neobittarella massiliensis]MBC3515563.1 methionyl-tRNA formyltransferase [Neobittarella massiliensis]